MPGGSGKGATSTTNVNLPNVYQPNAQPQADTSFQNINNLIGSQGLNAIQGLGEAPAQQYWPWAQLFGSQPFTNLGPAEAAATGAETAASAAPGIFDLGTIGGNQLANAGLGQLGYLNQLGSNAFDPMYSSVVNQVATNPFLAQQLQGAQLGANIGQGAANQAWGDSQSISSMIPGLQAGAGQILQTGFDPQGALKNQLTQETTDQTRAALAASGLSGTPYATGLESDALRNFNINWQNQQLQRQAQGLSGAAGADTAAGGLANTALGLGTGASGLAAASAAGPSNAWNSYNNQIVQALNARTQAGNQGAAGLSTLLGGAGNAFNQGFQAQDQAANWEAQLSNLPWQTQIGQTGSYLDTLNSLINTGNQNYQPGQQAIGNLESYLGLGQSANNIQNQIARSQQAQNQNAFGNQASIYSGLGNILGGGGAAGNLLFGSQGLSGALGLGQGGLLGDGISNLFDFGGGSALSDIFNTVGTPLGALEFP